MNKASVIFFLLLVGVLFPGFSALTVDEAVHQAEGHNLGLETEDLKLAQKADEKNFSVNRLYPSVSVNSTVLRLNNLNLTQWQKLWPALQNGASMPSYLLDKLGDETNHWVASVGLNAQWVLNLAVFRGITQTLIDWQNQKLSRDAAAAKLDRDVRKTFYQLLALHEATGVFENQLKVAEDRMKLAKNNFNAGLGSEISALQAQVTWENRKPILADQKLNEENAQAGFRLLLNLPDGAPLNLQGSLNVAPEVLKDLAALDVNALVKRYADGRWDVQTALGTAKSLGNLAQVQADSLWPSLIFGYSADPSVQAPFKDSAWSDPSNWAQTNGAFSMTLAWKLDSLMPGSTTGIEIAGRQRQARQAELGAQQIRQAGETEIRTLVGRLKKSAVSLESLALSFQLAERSSKLTEAGYQAGTQSLADAQDADLQRQTAQLQYLNEELSLQSTLADLDYSLAAARKEWFGHE